VPSENDSVVGPVVVLTGVMAAGKSTVGDVLARRWERGVHLRGDVFRRMIVSGQVGKGPEPDGEADRQLELRYRLAAQAAETYARAGFAVVLQDVILGPHLRMVVDLVRVRPLHVVVLAPSPEVVTRREAGRDKTGYGGGWTPARLDAVLRDGTPRIGLWLDTSELTADQTADAISARMSESAVA
jgi:chloramphenicol 3-O-phosphotransferase